MENHKTAGGLQPPPLPLPNKQPQVPNGNHVPPTLPGKQGTEPMPMPFDGFRRHYSELMNTQTHSGELRLCDLFRIGKLDDFKQEFLQSPERRRVLIEGLVANSVADSITLREFLMIRLAAMESMPPVANSERLDKMLEHHLKMIDALDNKVLHSVTFLDRLASPGGPPANHIAVAVQNNVSLGAADKKTEKAVFPPHAEEGKNE